MLCGTCLVGAVNHVIFSNPFCRSLKANRKRNTFLSCRGSVQFFFYFFVLFNGGKARAALQGALGAEPRGPSEPFALEKKESTPALLGH